jgi:glyoxylate/hydroxypyruvate reductase
MKAVIPFLSRSDSQTNDAWLVQLRSVLAAYDIVPFALLSEKQRHEATIAIVANPDPAEIQRLPNLIWVQSLWAGVERLVNELPARNLARNPAHDQVKIVRLVDPKLSQAMAEAVLAWTLYLSRNMASYRQQQNDRKWQQLPYRAASETTVGILGLGQLGKAAAQRLCSNGFQVAGWSRTASTIEGVRTFVGETQLHELLSIADIIVILLPLTLSTKNLFGEATLNGCKPGAAIINFGRGAIINETDLISCLNKGHLSHAVLDVFETEPLPKDNPLWQHDKVTILPHIAAPTNKSTASIIVAQNINRFFADATIPHHIDPLVGY